LWIRSAPAFSLDTLKPLPGEVVELLSPVHWWTLLRAVPESMLGSVLYPVLLLAFAVLLRYHKRLLELLENTSAPVGNVSQDSFLRTLEGMGFTALLAGTWPLLVATLGLALDAYPFDGRMERSVGFALYRTATYFFGLEFLRYLLVSEGLVRRHFGWAEANVKRLARKVWQLEVLFAPMVFVAIVAYRSTPQEGQSILTSLALIVALLALSRFFMQTPSVAPGEFKQLIAMRSARRQSLMGRALRYFLTALPLALVVCIVLGYTHTATEFLSSLVGTLALFTALLLIHELGVRWLKILRLRLLENERLKAEAAAREAAENPDTEQPVVQDFEQQNPDELDSEGRNLLNTLLVIVALVGVWGVWSDLLPALGILDAVPLWHTTELVDGVETLNPVTPLDIVQVLLVTFAGYVAVQRIPALLDLFLRQKMELASGTVYASVTLGRYVLITAFVILVLGMLGANWGQIQWAVAALSVGIGFGLQEIVANFISGIILLFEQPIRVGDTVTVGDTSGVVTKIRMRATTVRDWDGRELLVPNKEFITGRLLNWSLSDQQTRTLIEIGVAYGSDVPKAMKIALDVAREHENVLDDPEPFITFDSFGDNSLLLTLRCYLPSLERRLVTASEMRNTINDRYNEAGIVIAFPQRDVHLNGLGPIDVNIRNMNDLAAD
jgi:potassium efflux system protein